jgi:hypothetical protein
LSRRHNRGAENGAERVQIDLTGSLDAFSPVLAVTALMFTPPSNAWFRPGPAFGLHPVV